VVQAVVGSNPIAHPRTPHLAPGDLECPLSLKRADADRALVGVQRRYLAALGVAILAIAASLAIPKGNGSQPQVSQQQLRGMERAALQRLRPPRDFTRIDKGCTVDQCYLTSDSTGQVQALVPQFLRSSGLQPLGRLRAAEPVAQLEASHWSIAPGDSLVIACKRVSASASDPLETCQDAGRIGPTLVNVLVRPVVACQKRTCVNLRKTEVLAWSVALPDGS
jgi:hypothetical protein